MYKICLVNLPFAALEYPSIALTQIKYILEEKLGERVSTEVCYLNQDFARYLGIPLYREILYASNHFYAGLGEWFFRQTAFPTLSDNTEEYLQRFYPSSDPYTLQFKNAIREKRQGLEQFIDELIIKYQLGQAQLVGFTSVFYQNVACFTVARRLKELYPDIVVVMGGANCETPMGEEIVKNVKTIDFVFSGPALMSFPQFVEYRLNQDFEACHRISGVFSQANCLPEESQVMGSARVGPGTIGQELDINYTIELDYRPFLQSIKSVFPDRKIGPVLLFETSRGCWWGERAHCTFCGLNGLTMNYRAMKPQNAIKLINSLFAYTDECTHLSCVDNILPKNYPKDVFPFINTPPNVSIFYEVKADLSAADMQSLARARVTSIQPGIESLATSTLKLMKKGSTAFQNLRLMKYCVTYAVFPLWNLLVGFPGEKEEVYQKYLRDFPLLTHLPPPSYTYRVRFDRYSPYFTLAEEYGLDLQPLDFYELTYPFSKATLANFSSFFTDHNLHADYIVNYDKWIDKLKEKSAQWQRAWWPTGRAIWGKWFQDRPKLMFKQHGNDTLIYDSRSGEAVEYQISDRSKQLLDYLNQPLKKADLAAKFQHVSLDIEQEMAFLQDQGLLFQEDERFMSLVLPDETSTSSPAPELLEENQRERQKQRELTVVSLSQETSPE